MRLKYARDLRIAPMNTAAIPSWSFGAITMATVMRISVISSGCDCMNLFNGAIGRECSVSIPAGYRNGGQLTLVKAAVNLVRAIPLLRFGGARPRFYQTGASI